MKREHVKEELKNENILKEKKETRKFDSLVILRQTLEWYSFDRIRIIRTGTVANIYKTS